MDDIAEFDDQNRMRVDSRFLIFRGENHQPVDHIGVQEKSDGHWKCYVQW